ncbi:MAG: TonB-dependent receptor [Burkholderiales bacterium]|nr:TonB-dependent receptor [Burkholderiales bacterium]
MSPLPPLRSVCLAAALCLGGAAGVRAQDHADVASMSLEQLMQIRVLGASKYEQRQDEVAAAVSVITRDEIRALGWRTLAQALASLPGNHLTYDRQYTYLGTRGFALPGDFNTRILVMINGNRVNEPNNDVGQVGRQLPLDLDLVERIEYFPGPGGAVYGQNAMFGVVNLVTRTGREMNGGEAAAGWQTRQRLGEGRASWGGRLADGWDVLLSASAMRARGQDLAFDFGAAGVSGTASGMDGERDAEFFVRIGRGRGSFDFAAGRYRKDDPTSAYLSDPLVAGQYQGDAYWIAQWAWEDRLMDDRLVVSARLFAGQERYRASYSYGTFYDAPFDSSWRGGELRAVSTAIAGHRLMAGVEAQDNHEVAQQFTDRAMPEASIRISVPGFRVGVYAQDEWRISETLSATLGRRWDRDDRTGNKLSPRIALIWAATPQTTVRALAGRAHRSPNAYERDYFDGVSQVANPGLGKETIDTAELVVDWRAASDLLFRASLYRWKMHDMVTLGVDPVSGLSQYQTGDHADARGVEVSVDRSWASGARLRGSVTFQHATGAGDRLLPNAPRRLAKLVYTTPLPSVGLSLAYEFQAESARLALDGTRLGGGAVSNLTLRSTALAPGLDLSIGVHNLFDQKRLHAGADNNWQTAFEQDGRSLRTDLRYRF